MSQKVPKKLRKRLEEEILNNINNLSDKFGSITCITFDNELHIINGKVDIGGYRPNVKELRLALELIDVMYPLYKKADKRTKAEFVKDVFKYDVEIDHIMKIQPFKKILFRKKIVEVKKIKEGKYKTIIKRVRIK